MWRVPHHFVGVLIILGGGACLRLLIPPTVSPRSDLDLASKIPYRIGDYTGSDLELAPIIARAHDWGPRQLVLRQYTSSAGDKVELYAVANILDPALAGCYRYNGWTINLKRGSRVGSAPALSVQEFVALSPPGDPDETDVCVSYWRERQRALDLTLSRIVRVKLSQVARLQESGISVQLCDTLRGGSTNLEQTFSRLESFCLRLDPYLQYALR